MNNRYVIIAKTILETYLIDVASDELLLLGLFFTDMGYIRNKAEYLKFLKGDYCGGNRFSIEHDGNLIFLSDDLDKNRLEFVIKKDVFDLLSPDRDFYSGKKESLK